MLIRNSRRRLKHQPVADSGAATALFMVVDKSDHGSMKAELVNMLPEWKEPELINCVDGIRRLAFRVNLKTLDGIMRRKHGVQYDVWVYTNGSPNVAKRFPEAEKWQGIGTLRLFEEAGLKLTDGHGNPISDERLRAIIHSHQTPIRLDPKEGY